MFNRFINMRHRRKSYARKPTLAWNTEQTTRLVLHDESHVMKGATAFAFSRDQLVPDNNSSKELNYPQDGTQQYDRLQTRALKKAVGAFHKSLII